jgi:hypothetical protein
MVSLAQDRNKWCGFVDIAINCGFRETCGLY